MTHDLWAALNEKILDHLAGISLADMVASQTTKQKITIKPRINNINPQLQATESVVAYTYEQRLF